MEGLLSLTNCSSCKTGALNQNSVFQTRSFRTFSPPNLVTRRRLRNQRSRTKCHQTRTSLQSRLGSQQGSRRRPLPPVSMGLAASSSTCQLKGRKRLRFCRFARAALKTVRFKDLEGRSFRMELVELGSGRFNKPYRLEAQRFSHRILTMWSLHLLESTLNLMARGEWCTERECTQALRRKE